jgi:hypothetical protein
MPLLARLFSFGDSPFTLRISATLVGAAIVLIVALNALPVLPPSALGPVLAVNPEQAEQVGWCELTATVADAWMQAGPGAQIFARNYGQAAAVERYGPEYGLPQPYSGAMSVTDWGPPPDTVSGRVVVVGNRSSVFKGCRVIATHQPVIENEEDGTEVAVCDPVVWSRVWPELRRYYG